MVATDVQNKPFLLALELLQSTDRNIFLTGKAGTGKTTFLRQVVEHTPKNCAVVAPTGVAAINAGGVTMHSFFALPFEPFLPVHSSRYERAVTKQVLFQKSRLSTVRREVLEELELLIIDEVSMLRSDQLDMIDTILRHVRKKPHAAFGGVQVLFIGDMFQLPPVVRDEDKLMLDEYYAGPYFFQSKVLEDNPPLHVELKKIYRQKEQQFIDLLNNIRNNTIQDDDMQLLRRRLDPAFDPLMDDAYITITTHNAIADNINSTALRKLPGRSYTFAGEVEGEFSEKALPADPELTIKPYAKVMFVRNDSGEDRKYYNGRLATIKRVEEKSITVEMLDDGSELELQKSTWENIRYTLDKNTGKIEEETVGTYKQYPIRLAWAITIHKSQGLTFDKVVIDAGRSFAAGQVYVALSRCTTLDGMVLLSDIPRRGIDMDAAIIAFSKTQTPEHILEEILGAEKNVYLKRKTMDAFQTEKFTALWTDFAAEVPAKNIPEKETALKLAKDFLQAALEMEEVAGNFRKNLPALLDGDAELRNERMRKAIHWFCSHIRDKIYVPLQEHALELQHSAKGKLYKKYLSDLMRDTELQIKKFCNLYYADVQFITSDEIAPYIPQQKELKKEKRGRKKKGDSKLETLAYFRSGRSIPEIAEMRKLAISTITGHLVECIPDGDITPEEFIPEEKIARIQKAIAAHPGETVSVIRQSLGNDVQYAEVQALMPERK